MSALSRIIGVLMVAGFIPYVIAIGRKETRPEKASWFIWAAIDVISAVAMYYEGALNGLIVGSAIGAIIVAVLSVKYGKPGWSRTDKICLAGAVSAITLWQTFNDPRWAIIISSIAAFIGALPTIESAWQDSGAENKFAWTTWWIGCVLAMVAIPKWDIANSAAPITFLAVESIMMYILFLRPYVAMIRLAKHMRG